MGLDQMAIYRLKWSRYWALPLVVKGRSLGTLTQKIVSQIHVMRGTEKVNKKQTRIQNEIAPFRFKFGCINH